MPEQNVSSQRIRRFKGYELIVNNPALAWIRRKVIPQRLRDAVKSNLTLKKRPQIDEQRMLKLTTIFNEDLANFGDLLGIEINMNNYSSIAKSVNASLIEKN